MKLNMPITYDFSAGG